MEKNGDIPGREREQTIFHSIESYDFAGQFEQILENPFIIRKNQKDLKEYFEENTSETIAKKNQSSDFSIRPSENEQLNQTCIDEFQDFINKMPPQLGQSTQNIFANEKKSGVEYSLVEKKINKSLVRASCKSQIKVLDSKRLNQFQTECMVEYGSNVAIKTICRVENAQIMFHNGGCNIMIINITKIKVLFENFQKIICFTYQEKKGNKFNEVKFKIWLQNDVKDETYYLFAQVVVEKLKLMDHLIDKDSVDDPQVDKFIMNGELFKKGQHLNSWSKRKIILTDRIESFKGEKCTFEIKNIKQIWTRFQFYNKECLIIKIRHGIDKTQLAIPVVNFIVRYCKENWLFRIYKLVKASSI